MCWLGRLFNKSGVEKPSPSNIVPEENIVAAGLGIFIKLEGINVTLTQMPKIWIPMIPDTNSMDGVFDYGNNNILIAGQDEADHKRLIDFITLGDIAVYESDGAYPLTIHRIVKIGNDSQGKYFIFKGDNNATEDSGKVRESEIKWVSVGVIY